MKNLIIASDLHLNPIWDKIDNIIPKKYNFINPNTKFKELLNKITTNDLLILNGDIVESYYSDYYKKENISFNYFFKLLNKYKINNYLINAGNHEYRKLIGNFKFSGLTHLNLPNSILKKYIHKIEYNYFRFLKEIDSIFPSNFKNLNNYNFKKYFIKNIENKRLIFLDTQSDDIFSFSNLSLLKNPKNLSETTPTVKGLSKKQLLMLKKDINNSKQDIFIFIHAPLFFSTSFIKSFYLKLNNYYKQLNHYCLNFGIFNRNNYNFLLEILKSKNNIFIISSHTHKANCYLLNKANLLLSNTKIDSINKYRNNNKYIKFISTPSLSQIVHYNKEIGYLIINDQSIKFIINEKF